MQDDLVFPISGEPQGFSTLVTTSWDGKPEPIVRELLQNCLDAAAEVKRKAEVDFEIRQVPLDQVPGIQSYRRHFEMAVAERETKKQGAAEKQVIRRIRAILEAGSVRLLVCRDNGVGVDTDRMERLLTEGNTDKDSEGAGAFGIGHLTAFAGSDLRYLLYAGRSLAPEGDEMRDVASGHAILASRYRQGGGGRGGKGFWLRGNEPTLFDTSSYPAKAPPLLRRELDELDTTGSVVCITGFNNFRREPDPADAIARVAAKNFLVAIWEGKMIVRVRGEDGHEVEVTPDTLGPILMRDREKKRGEQGAGWFPGAEAHQAWEALTSGEEMELKAGAVARFLSLKAHKGRPKSRVQVFRNGMWITNRADELLPPYFKTHKPFVAVIMIKDGELSRLVRGAEGPEHRGLDRRRLASQDSKDLLALLRQIADELRAKAGSEERTGRFLPEDFLMLSQGVQRKAERVRRYRPRPGAGRRGATTLRRGNGKSIDPRPRTTKVPRRNQGAAPKAGRGAPGRSSVVAVRNGSGQVDQVRVVWQPPSDGAWQVSDRLGVRVRVPSGSDETCEVPLGPQWLAIREVRHDGVRVGSGDNPYEVELPGDARNFTVLLAEPATDPNAVEVDLVRRRPALSPADAGPTEDSPVV